VDDGSRLTATGVVWSADGVILTTSHGVERDEEVSVETADGTRLPASVAGRDPDADLAVLRVSASGLPALGRAGTDEAQVGHLVLALGRPGDFGLQATFGIISARIEVQTEGRPEHLLSTDANLYPGFSGGPLVDVSGRLVGLINLNYGRGQGVALGVPILEHVVPTLLAQGTVARGYLGVSTQAVPLPEALRSTLGLTQPRGLLVVQVQAGGPAEASGLILGDLLLGLDGQPVEDVDALRRLLRSLSAGQGVSLDIARAGQRQSLAVTLGKQD
jgi:S1-C subfamily serine protease